MLSSDTGTSVAQSSTGPRDDADVGVGRTMTAASVLGDELAFLRQVQLGLDEQQLEYQHGQLVLDSFVLW